MREERSLASIAAAAAAASSSSSSTSASSSRPSRKRKRETAAGAAKRIKTQARCLNDLPDVFFELVMANLPFSEILTHCASVSARVNRLANQYLNRVLLNIYPNDPLSARSFSDNVSVFLSAIPHPAQMLEKQKRAKEWFGLHLAKRMYIPEGSNVLEEMRTLFGLSHQLRSMTSEERQEYVTEKKLMTSGDLGIIVEHSVDFLGEFFRNKFGVLALRERLITVEQLKALPMHEYDIAHVFVGGAVLTALRNRWITPEHLAQMEGNGMTYVLFQKKEGLLILERRLLRPEECVRISQIYDQDFLFESLFHDKGEILLLENGALMAEQLLDEENKDLIQAVFEYEGAMHLMREGILTMMDYLAIPDRVFALHLVAQLIGEEDTQIFQNGAVTQKNIRENLDLVRQYVFSSSGLGDEYFELFEAGLVTIDLLHKSPLLRSRMEDASTVKGLLSGAVTVQDVLSEEQHLNQMFLREAGFFSAAAEFGNYDFDPEADVDMTDLPSSAP